jgi:hypothetical protein
MYYTLIYLAEAIYVIYMLNYFKTTINFAHPATYFESPLLYHPVTKLTEPINPVCPLGNAASWILAGYLIVRGVVFDYGGETLIGFMNSFTLTAVVIIVLMSLMNFNVLVYLSPIIIHQLIELS